MRLLRGHIFVTNPKTMDRLDVTASTADVGSPTLAERETCYVQLLERNGDGDDYDDLIGEAQLVNVAWNVKPPGFLRIHAEVAAPRSGYGIALYLASAVVAKKLGFKGVYSSHLRSHDAIYFWEKLIRAGIGEQWAAFDLLTAEAALKTGLVEVRR